MVGVEGFEPPTSRSQSARSTKLSQTPIMMTYIASIRIYVKFLTFYIRFFDDVKGLL